MFQAGNIERKLHRRIWKQENIIDYIICDCFAFMLNIKNMLI